MGFPTAPISRRAAADADMVLKERHKTHNKNKVHRSTSAMDTTAKNGSSLDGSLSSRGDASPVALDLLKGGAAKTADAKVVTPKPISLRDIPVSIHALDAIVGKDESLHQQEQEYMKGSFRDWQQVLHRNQDKFAPASKAMSEGRGFEHQCRRRHNPLMVSRRSQMNELEYLNQIHSSYDRKRYSTDISDRRSMELQFDEEYSVTPSHYSKRSGLPKTILTSVSRDETSEEGTPLQTYCENSSSLIESSRKNWFERPDSLKGKLISEKPRPMRMVFFDDRQSKCSSEGSDSNDPEIGDTGDLTPHKSLCKGKWSGNTHTPVVEITASNNDHSRVDPKKSPPPTLHSNRGTATGQCVSDPEAHDEHGGILLDSNDSRYVKERMLLSSQFCRKPYNLQLSP